MAGSSRRRDSLRARRVALLAMALATWSCDFRDRTGLGAALEVTLSSSTVTVAQGETESIEVTLDRLNGFADPVSVLVEGLPTGVRAAALTFAAGATTGTLALTAASDAPVGTSALTLHAHSVGSAAVAATAAFSLVVQPAGPGFSLSFAPAIVGVPQGTSRTTTVTIARTGGFIGAVELSTSTLPPGITAFFNPATVFAATATLTLTASPTASLGAAPITVNGGGTGVAGRSVTITANVTPAGGPTGNVSVALCPAIGTPIWVAFQDGTAPWVLSTAVNGVYSGQVSSGRGGLAYVVPSPAGGFAIHVHYGTTVELQGFGDLMCQGVTGAGKTVNVSVSGNAPPGLAHLALGSSITTAQEGTTPRFLGVPNGSLDLAGARISPAVPRFVLSKLFVQRGLDPAPGSTVSVDFNGPGAVDPVFGTATIANLGADQALVTTYYRTANRTLLWYSIGGLGTNPVRTFGGFPAFPGSFHLVEVIAGPEVPLPDRSRAAGVVHAAIGDRTVTLGPDLSAITVAQAGTSPPLRMEAVIPTTTYNGSWSVTFAQGTGAQLRAVRVSATAGYLGGSPSTVTLVVPDLSTAAGFDNLWALAETATIDWSVEAHSTTGFGRQIPWQEGATFISATRSGTFRHHGP
jgi:hypothetical protein